MASPFCQGDGATCSTKPFVKVGSCLKKTWSPSQKLSPAFDGFFLGEVLVFKLSFDDPNDFSVLWALLSGNLNDELWFLPWPCDACQVSPFWLGWVHSIHLVPWFPVAA